MAVCAGGPYGRRLGRGQEIRHEILSISAALHGSRTWLRGESATTVRMCPGQANRTIRRPGSWPIFTS